ncbi:hypothetical protein [Kitasatospora sp. NPDC085879]|uniref:hypothetical protein n=1 Tax=Kitasatospora sp. NPDC085879 TaxID=3154769 RepID=UPI003442E688
MPPWGRRSCTGGLIEIEQGRTIGTLATWRALAHAFDIPLGGLAAKLCDDHTPPGT